MFTVEQAEKKKSPPFLRFMLLCLCFIPQEGIFGWVNGVLVVLERGTKLRILSPYQISSATKEARVIERQVIYKD